MTDNSRKTTRRAAGVAAIVTLTAATLLAAPAAQAAPKCPTPAKGTPAINMCAQPGDLLDVRIGDVLAPPPTHRQNQV